MENPGIAETGNIAKTRTRKLSKLFHFRKNRSWGLKKEFQGIQNCVYFFAAVRIKWDDIKNLIYFDTSWESFKKFAKI